MEKQRAKNSHDKSQKAPQWMDSPCQESRFIIKLYKATVIKTLWNQCKKQTD